ncbi:MAG: ATP-binding cassette domain-containing protein [Bacteroidetes bacterium]|nr:ATP-binding cassette domain-containing protein [Bacteroidota bacterium]
MLEVKNISTGYDKKQVLFDISLSVGHNEIVLLTGGNGSGKSTILKCIYGLLPIWNKEGKIIFDGRDITKLATYEMVKAGIVYIPQKNNYFESLTVHENFIVSGSIYSNDVIKQREQEVYKLTDLYKYRNRTPFNLSGGERQLLALGNALMHKPRFILFDEPFSGLDQAKTKIMVDELLQLKQQQISMLVVEHKKIFNTFADKEFKLDLGKLI